MVVDLARWADLDPGTHPFDLEQVRGPIEALVLEAARADPVDREGLVLAIDRLLLVEHGAWTGGWRWAASEPGGGGPVRGWCCSQHSVFRADDPDPLATARRALAAIARWRDYLVELAARFAELRAEAAGPEHGRTSGPPAGEGARPDLARAAERAAARLLPFVVERTGAEDAWYQTFAIALGWYLEELTGVHGDKQLQELVEEVTSGRFQSWIGPDEETAREACAALGAAVANAEPPGPRDALAEWLGLRPTVFGDHAPRPRAGPVLADGHERFIEQVDRRRDPVRADRMAAALVLCRDSARHGMRLTLDQLAEWQGVVLGLSAPAPFRTGPAHAKGGRERYAIAPDTQRRFEAALADAHGHPDSAIARAIRAYLDVCFFHPFEDGNARAARLALDHVLTSAGLALHAAEPVFVVARAADDARGALAFAHVLEQLAGPRA